MPLPTSPPFPARRPAGPRCRGGASSLLRLAQPAGAHGFGPWIARATSTAAFAGGLGDTADGMAQPRVPSIITRLLPSRDLPASAPPLRKD
jgi:hypothetical protein